MNFLRVGLLVTASLLVSSLSLHAQSVAEENGSIFFTGTDGVRKQLTDGGRDSAPVLAPDGKQVAFIRGTPGKTIATGAGDNEATELWLIGIDGSKPTLLIQGRDAQDVKQVIAGIGGADFSPDGKLLYFVCSAWATSGAVHVIDLATKKERFFTDGSSLEVVANGEYKGCLLIQKHRYFIGGGSYDWYWLLKPDGSEVGPVGEDTDNFRSTYVK